MRFTETRLNGAYIIDLEERPDERGFFGRTYCAREFEAHGLRPTMVQCSLAFNRAKGTLRGLHYQAAPTTETKLIRCTRGAIYDVIVDLRPESASYLQHLAVELTEHNRRTLYVPEMFAHGYQTLVDGAEVFYQMGDFYNPGSDRGLCYDDPALGIAWPLPISLISEKDQRWPLLDSAWAEPRSRADSPGSPRMRPLA